MNTVAPKTLDKWLRDREIMLAALKRTQEVWSEWETYAPWIGEAIAQVESK